MRGMFWFSLTHPFHAPFPHRAQGIFILLQVIMIFMLFSGTYLFQVGLINTLVREFAWSLGCIGIYAIIFGFYAIIKGHYFERVPKPILHNDGLWLLPSYQFASGLQKIASLFYYLSILQTCGRLGESIWYWRGPWVARYSNQAPSEDVERGAADRAR